MKLLKEQLEQVEQLAGCHYGPRDIATYLQVPEKLFMKAWHEKTSAVRDAYDRGVLKTQAEIDMQIADSAKGGNITAAQQWAKRKTEQHLDNIKTELFDGKI